MVISCVLLSHFPLRVALLRQPALLGKAALILEGAEGKKRVLDCSPEASPAAPGMPLQEALSRCPRAALIEADGVGYARLWGQLLNALERRSPLVEDASLGLAYVGLDGLAPMYGGEAGLLRVLLNAMPLRYGARFGIGAGKFPAYLAAEGAQAGGAKLVPSDAATFVASVSVTQLPTTWELKERLVGFGLETLGDLARMPFPSLQAEFGKEGARLWQLANGEDTSALIPRRHDETYALETTFAEPTTSLPAILVALEGLLRRVFRLPQMRGRYAREASLQATSINGPWQRRIAFHEPLGDSERALFALRSNLEHLVLPGPLEALALTLSGITGETARQESLFSDVQRQAQLDDALRQLQSRLNGRVPIYRIREVEPWSRIPERQRVLMRYNP